MDKQAWSGRTLLKYWTVQIPTLFLVAALLLLLENWMEMADWVFWGIIVLWITKDALLYPLVWKAYAPHSSKGNNSMVGTVGEAVEQIAPDGYVLVRGELWLAKVKDGAPSIEKGQAVLVRGVKGLTLLVEPAEGPSPADSG